MTAVSYLLLVMLHFFPIVVNTSGDPGPSVSERVKPGIDVLRDQGFAILRGKRVGLITNPTGVTANLESTIDVLHQSPDVQLVALYGPEHGVRGDMEAGAHIGNYVDTRTGLPVYSLYGSTRKPTPEMLRGVDVLVYDIQDIGVRSYTYISTMGNAMEAAAEQNIPFVVLDRPDPISGDVVGGTMIESEYFSFVGMYPVPYVYGMTAGELALMINGEGWLKDRVVCTLEVVQMEGWKRSMMWKDTGLFWVPTSPHIPRGETALFYALTGLLGELGTANQGVGYTLPFELVGAPWIDGQMLAGYLNKREMDGVEFRPMSYRPFYFDTTGGLFGGLQIYVTNARAVDVTEVQIAILEALLRLYPDKNIFDRAKPNRIRAFDKVIGSDEVRKKLLDGESVESIVNWADQQRSVFMIKRAKYLLYQ